MPAEEQVETWLHEFDLDADGTISEHEFVTGLAKWAKRVAQEKIVSRPDERMNTIDIQESDFWAAKSNEAKAVSPGFLYIGAENTHLRPHVPITDTSKLIPSI